MHRPSLQLTRACDNACRFCAQEGLEPLDPAPDLQALLLSIRARTDELTIVGGEPTLSERLVDAVRLARDLGFVRVGLQTNGRMLSGALAATLRDAGLTDVHLSLHAGQPAAHDYLVGREGAYRDALAGLGAARSAGLEVAVTTVVARSNYRVLHELPPLLHRLGVLGWCLSFVRVVGRARANFDRLVPRLALAAPFVLQSLVTARRLGLPSWVQNVPTCVLGPYAAHSLVDPNADRAFNAAACGGCSARTSCGGIDPSYLERFGDQELRPALAVPPDLGDGHVRRMFVGAGEEGPGLAAPIRAGAPVQLVALGRR